MSKKRNKNSSRHGTTRSNRVRILPIHHDQPDLHKLGRAFIALALHEAAQEKQAQQQTEQADNYENQKEAT
ncbi:hypothetical protein [Acidithrix ferrooxidans]|uniref:Uncharacterized protein n=1 Tax=Acidithrix ferrooxidans TaxID=1280514 RepID=A0A0D8HJV7_9ACTN|nr:hypothetical protein [Acidithrix ferrooxidans]KJF18184.1 hypothetical protein AXFE_09290 [Acidithrix ferrooxidans]